MEGAIVSRNMFSGPSARTDSLTCTLQEVMYGIVASLCLTAFHLESTRYEYHPDDPWDTYGDTMDAYAVADRCMNASPPLDHCAGHPRVPSLLTV